MEFLKTFLGGAGGAALVAGLFGVIQWRLGRKAKKEDAAEERGASNCFARGLEIQKLSAQVEGLIIANQVQLYDRIKYLAKAHIKRGYILVEDLEDLKRMHRVYHDELKGNGFLDSLMAEVERLEKRVM